MKKIKKIWEENKVLLVLAIILIICIVVLNIVAMTYFYGASDNVYGNRLDSIKNIPLNDKLIKEIKETLESNESVNKTSVTLKGKILYINIYFVDATKMDDAKKIAESTLELFNEDELKVYDIEYSINCLSTEDVVGYTLMGARNSNGSGNIIWNNYNKEESANKA